MLEGDYLQKVNSMPETGECQVKQPCALLEQLSRTGVAPSFADDNRQYVRERVFNKAVLQLWQSIPSVERESRCFSILTKDLGVRSVGFFHTEQLYPGEQHFIFIESAKMKCTVQRCSRHNEQCFEIGSSVNETVTCC